MKAKGAAGIVAYGVWLMRKSMRTTATLSSASASTRSACPAVISELFAGVRKLTVGGVVSACTCTVTTGARACFWAVSLALARRVSVRPADPGGSGTRKRWGALVLTKRSVPPNPPSTVASTDRMPTSS
ncbi:hypothetical protein COSO111634_23425 [Corallococcus soli]